MAIHWVGTQSNVLVRLSETPRFAIDREYRADGASVDCPSGRPKDRGDCEGCTRFRGWSEDTGGVTRAQCTWSDHDPVESCMTLAVDVVSVSPAATCEEAAALLQRHGFHHLPVIRAGTLEGVICGCDLKRSTSPQERVDERMSRDVLALMSGTRLGDAVAAMELCKIHFLPVISNGILVGVITRSDLVRIGAPMKAEKNCD